MPIDLSDIICENYFEIFLKKLCYFVTQIALEEDIITQEDLEKMDEEKRWLLNVP